MDMKLNVLLVDDRGDVDLGQGGKYPYMRGILEDHFNVIWIRNAYEGRWLLEAFDELCVFAPSKLLESGIPPEIMIFDYALTSGLDRATIRPDDPTDILPYISNLARKFQIDIPKHPKDYDVIPHTGADQGKDNMGCYLGGELSRAFLDYPCGPIPTTAHRDVVGSDAAFYEWLNDRYFNHAFAKKNRKPMWDTTVRLGTKEFRRRMVTLTRSGLITPSISQLQVLIENPIDALGELEENVFQGMIKYGSYFGERKILLSSVFFDELYPAKRLTDYADGTLEASINGFSKSAKAWATTMLEALFKTENGFNEFLEAKQLANLYFKAWESDQHVDRYWMADNLLNMNSANAGENDKTDEKFQKYSLNYKRIKEMGDDKFQKEFQNLCVKFEFNPDSTNVLYSSCEIGLHDGFITLPPLYKALKNKPAVIRWAILTLMLYAEEYFALKSDVKPLLNPSSTLAF